jgi:hypothetical protein
VKRRVVKTVVKIAVRIVVKIAARIVDPTAVRIAAVTMPIATMAAVIAKITGVADATTAESLSPPAELV